MNLYIAAVSNAEVNASSHHMITEMGPRNYGLAYNSLICGMIK